MELYISDIFFRAKQYKKTEFKEIRAKVPQGSILVHLYTGDISELERDRIATLPDDTAILILGKDIERLQIN